MFSSRAKAGARGIQAKPRAKSAFIMWGAAACLGLAAYGLEQVRAAVLGPMHSARTTPLTDRSKAAAVVPAQSPPFSRAEVLSSDDWLNNIRSERYWAGRKSSGSTGFWGGNGSKQAAYAPMQLGGDWNVGRPGSASADGSYRTVCVRLCDGFFFPISSSVSAGAFADDARQCASRCSAPARLFVYRNGSETPDDMVDLDDRPYRRLKTAFLYRTTYDASCKCKPHPWEEEATDRHRMYALQVETRKGSKKAAAELAALRLKISARDTPAARASAATHDATASKAGKARRTTGNMVKKVPESLDLEDVGLAWGSTKAPAAASVAEAPRAKGSVKVMRLGGTSAPSAKAQPAYRKVTSRDDDWRRRALNIR